MQFCYKGRPVSPDQLDAGIREVRYLKADIGNTAKTLRDLQAKAVAYSDKDYVCYSQPLLQLLRELDELCDCYREGFWPLVKGVVLDGEELRLKDVQGLIRGKGKRQGEGQEGDVMGEGGLGGAGVEQEGRCEDYLRGGQGGRLSKQQQQQLQPPKVEQMWKGGEARQQLCQQQQQQRDSVAAGRPPLWPQRQQQHQQQEHHYLHVQAGSQPERQQRQQQRQRQQEQLQEQYRLQMQARSQPEQQRRQQQQRQAEEQWQQQDEKEAAVSALLDLLHLPSSQDWRVASWRYPPNEFVLVKPKGVRGWHVPVRLPGVPLKVPRVRRQVEWLGEQRGEHHAGARQRGRL